MNIFALGSSPELAASYHCDKHLVSQIKESVQIMSSAIHLLISENRLRQFSNDHLNSLPKPTHLGHRCVRWAKTSKENFEWLRSLCVYLNALYFDRYNRTHLYIQNDLSRICASLISQANFSETGLTPFARAMPEEISVLFDGINSKKRLPLKDQDISILSYRLYYYLCKSEMSRWEGRLTPEWADRKWWDEVVEMLAFTSESDSSFGVQILHKLDDLCHYHPKAKSFLSRSILLEKMEDKSVFRVKMTKKLIQ